MIKKIILITIITFITFGVIACSSNSGEALIDTARNEDLETAKLLIENGADINANDKDGDGFNAGFGKWEFRNRKRFSRKKTSKY